MGVFEILLIVFCSIFVITVGTIYVIKRKKGKCSCGCSDCAYKGQCHKNKEQNEK